MICPSGIYVWPGNCGRVYGVNGRGIAGEVSSSETVIQRFGSGEPWAWETAMGIKRYAAAPMATLAFGLFFAPTVLIAIGAMVNTVASLVSPAVGDLGLISPAMAQPDAPAEKQSDALSAYNQAVRDFESILEQRRAQIDLNQRLPNLPGQALYLARINMMSAYKDLTDAVPSKIGGPNKFGIPPAYLDAKKEPLVDEYRALFDVMEAPPANAQKSATPFKDVVDLAIAIARAKGLDAANAKRQAVSAWDCSSPRPTAIKTSVTRVRIPTREVSRPARPKIKTVEGNGRRSNRR